MPCRLLKVSLLQVIFFFSSGEQGCCKYQGPNPLLPAAASVVDLSRAEALVLL